MSKTPTILIIDDNEENRYRFSRYLKKDGFEVQEAANGTEGLKKARQNPDLIMLDIQLPDMNGFDICRTLKSDPATNFIPVLHTSATFTESSDRTQGLSGGADGYLIQPIDPEELLATVKALLRVREAEAAANKLAAQWKTTFDAINDGVCLVNYDGRIERHNRALEDIFSRDNLEDFSFAALLKEKEIDPGFFHDVVSCRHRATHSVKIGERFLQLTLNPVGSEPSVKSGLACVFSDVTAIRRAEEALQQHNEELERRVRQRTAALNDANAQLESFCYSVAHDLRAPIRTMQGFSDILLEDYSAQLDEDAKRYLERIHKGSQRMDRLIQDLLKYSRLSREEIVLENVSLLDCITSLLNDSERDFSEKRAAFTLEIPRDIIVQAHLITLRQAIWNLLSNAVKFVAEGMAPKILLRTERNGEFTRLLIQDNGIGINPEHQGKIFDMFERIHSDTYAGTGIGLAIVRRAMERMGGSVGVQSVPGEGTTFWLEFKKGDRGNG